MQILTFLPNPHLGRGIIVGETETHIEILYETDFELNMSGRPTRFVLKNLLRFPWFSVEIVEKYDEPLAAMLKFIIGNNHTKRIKDIL